MTDITLVLLEFDGSTTVESSNYPLLNVGNAKLLCQLCCIKWIKQVLPLCLIEGAFAAYHLLSTERYDESKIKDVLDTVFAKD